MPVQIIFHLRISLVHKYHQPMSFHYKITLLNKLKKYENLNVKVLQNYHF